MIQFVYVWKEKNNSIHKIGSTQCIVNRMRTTKTHHYDFDDTKYDLWIVKFDDDNDQLCYQIDEFIRKSSEKYNYPFNKYNGTGGIEFYQIPSLQTLLKGMNEIIKFFKIDSSLQKVSVDEIIKTTTKKSTTKKKSNNKLLVKKSIDTFVNKYKNGYQLIKRPCQSGKTFEMITLIENDKKDSPEIINIIFCDNSLLQVAQARSRLSKFNVVEISSKSKYKQFSDISKNQMVNLDIIICCGNWTQIPKLLNLIELYPNNKFNLWIDEADKIACSQKRISDFKAFRNRGNINNITYITATPSKVRNIFSPIYEINNDNNYDTYHFFKNSKFHLTSYSSNDVFSTVNSHLENCKLNDQLMPGQVWFIPSKRTKKDHNKMKDLLHKHNFYVLTVNSNGKIVSYKENGKNFMIDIDHHLNTKNKGVSEWIGEFYKKYNLDSKLFAITGQICIERGITISSDKMMITHAIFADDSLDDARTYQIAGRTCGRFKENDNFTVPTIYCSKRFKQRVLRMEKDVA